MSWMKSCQIVDLGLIGYAEAYALQKRVVAARKADAIGDVLLLCEHTPVITQGRNGKREHLLVSENVLRQRNVEFLRDEPRRGCYVSRAGAAGGISDFAAWSDSEGCGLVCADAGRGDDSDFGGVWDLRAARRGEDWDLGWERRKRFLHRGTERAQSSQREEGIAAEKLGAIGVHISRWVTSHGFAYNVATDLRSFDLIVPCGIAGRKATSLEKLLGRAVKLKEVAPKIVRDILGMCLGWR